MTKKKSSQRREGSIPMVKPINEKNAIEKAVFVIAFDQPFSREGFMRVEGLRESLKNEFPVYTPLSHESITLTTDAPPRKSVDSHAGVIFRKLDSDNKPQWEITAEKEVVVVTCFDYSRWKEISRSAIHHLVTIANNAVSDQLVSMIALQVMDRFIDEAKDVYNIENTFRIKSDHLTRRAKSYGQLWHIHQGWFEVYHENEAQCLHKLNISTSNTQTGTVANIDHTMRLIFNPGLMYSSLVENSLLDRAFDWMHTRNKDVLKELLNPELAKAVGL